MNGKGKQGLKEKRKNIICAVVRYEKQKPKSTP